MHKILPCILLFPLLLAGCAAPTTVASLRSDGLLRGERRLPLTSYAQVQKALFEHARVCGRALTTSQSASLAARGEVKRGSHFMEPKAPQTGGGEAPTARSGFFTFALDARSTTEATVVYALDDPPQLQRTVLVDLRQVYGWNGLQILAKAYAGHQVGTDGVEHVFAAMLDPATCPVP